MAVSCVYEDEVPCAFDLRFVYDYNMEYADAFPAQIDDVTLYVFDENGLFIAMREDSGEHLGADYRMTVDLRPATYTLVAWAGTQGEEATYPLPVLTPGVSTLDDLTLKLRTDVAGISQNALPELWHGIARDVVVTGSSHVHHTVNLVKNTNHFRVLLQNTEGEPVSKDDFSLSIRTDDGWMNYDNTLLDDVQIEYRPFVQREAAIDNDADAETDADASSDASSDAAGDGGEVRSAVRSSAITAVVAELSTLRLCDGRNARFTLKNGDTAIFDIDLLRYLDLMKLESYASLPLQEYLDRENTWQVILFLGKGGVQGTWTVAALQINDWYFIVNHTDL